MAFGFHFKTPHLGIRERLSFFWTKTTSFFTSPFRRFRAWRGEKTAPRHDFSESRFGRFISGTGRVVRRITQVFFVSVCVGVVALGIGVGALYYFVTTQTAQDALSRLARESLDARVTLSGPVSLKRLPDLVVEFPKLQLTRLDGTEVLADIDSIQAHLSLWSLPLGVVRVQDLTINGLKTRLSQDAFIGDDAFKDAFGATRFPDGLRIKNVSLKNSSVRVLATNTGRAKYVNEALAFIKTLPETTGRDVYLEIVHDKSRVAMNILRDGLVNEISEVVFSEPQIQKSELPVSLEAARFVLNKMASGEEYAKPMDVVSRDVFGDNEVHKLVYDYVKEKTEAGEKPQAHMLYSLSQDEEVANVLNSVKEFHDETKLIKYYRDSVKLLNLNYVNYRIKTLSQSFDACPDASERRRIFTDLSVYQNMLKSLK